MVGDGKLRSINPVLANEQLTSWFLYNHLEWLYTQMQDKM